MAELTEAPAVPWRMGVTQVDRTIAAMVRAQRVPVFGWLVRMLLLWRGTDIDPRAEVGEGLLLPHTGIGVIVHWKTRIGRNVTLWQGVTVGRGDIWRPASSEEFGVTLEDGVTIGAHAVVLFSDEPVVIGRGAMIGANSVVTRSVPAGEVWAGSPARKVGTV